MRWPWHAHIEVVADVLLTFTPDSAPGGVPGLGRVVWTGPLPLADLKAAGRATGATLNDVLVSVLAGALHRYARPSAARLPSTS